MNISRDTHMLKQVVNEQDWEFRDADTQYLTHNIHRYSGKFIPQIASTAIELLTDQGESVLDLYMGSGTTLLEAARSGRNAVGVDLNPVAVMIAEAKLARVDKKDFLEFRDQFLLEIDAINSTQSSLFADAILLPPVESLEKYNDDWNRKWYQLPVLEQLVLFDYLIERIEDPVYRNISRVALSNILRKSSNANSRFPNVMFDKNAKEKPLPLKAFKDSFVEVCEAVLLLQDEMGEKPGSIEIHHGNNTDMPYLENESFDAIVTHPPYVGAIPYAEYCSLSLQWFGYDNKALDLELTGGKRQRKDVIDRFERDYASMFREAYRVLRPGRIMFSMVGNPTVRGEVYDLEAASIRCAEKNGFSHVATATREGVNRRGNNMGSEYLQFFVRS